MSGAPGGFILAAGRGSRLRPVTDHLPKPAMPLAGMPLIAWALLHLHGAGVERAGVNAHHLADRLRLTTETWLTANLHRMGLAWSVEEELLGTGGGLSRARSLGLFDDSAPLLVVNSDVLCDVDARALVESHVASGADATLLVKPRPDADRFGAVCGDGSGRLTDLAGLWASEQAGAAAAPEAVRGVFTGISVLGPALWRHLPGPDEVSCVVRQGLAPLAAAGGDIRVVAHDGRWQDLGTPERFLEGQAMALAGDWPLPTADPGAAGAAVFRGAAYGRDGAGREYGDRRYLTGAPEIEGAVFIAPGCRFGENVTIGPNAVLGPGVSIDSGARVRDVCLLARARVERGAQLRGAVAGLFGGRDVVAGNED